MPTNIKSAISTDQAPEAIGPYSQAIQIGDLLFTSGQIPLDPRTNQFVPGGIVEQTTQVFENLKAVLTAAGIDFSHVVKATVYVKDLKDFATVNQIYGTYLAGPGMIAPARTTVQVAALPKDALVEIDLIANLPRRSVPSPFASN